MADTTTDIYDNPEYRYLEKKEIERWTKNLKEPNEIKEATELARRQAQSNWKEAHSPKKDQEERAQDTDHTDDTDPSTGRTTINGRALGSDSATGGTIPPAGNNGNGNGGNVPPNNNGGQPNQPAAPMPQRPQQPLISKDEFRGKARSFFNPDVPKNFWNTLEEKLDKMFSGNTAEDIAQNMFFGAIELFFDMLTNAIDHRRKERQKQDEEYLKTKEAYEKEIGISGRHKKSLAIMMAAYHRGLNYQSRPTDDDKKAMYKYINSKAAIKDYIDKYQAVTGTECTEAEAKQVLKSIGKKSITKAAIKDQLRGVKLSDDMFKRLGQNSLSATAQRIHGDHLACKAHEEQLAINKEALRQFKISQAQQQMQQGRQGPGPQHQQPQPQLRPQQQGRGP